MSTEDEYKALQEAIAKAKDPISSFKPSGPAQAECWDSMARFRMLHGRNQGGKSYLACIDLTHMLRCTHPVRPGIKQGKYLVIVPTRTQGAEVYGQYLFRAAGCPGPAGSSPMMVPDTVDGCSHDGVPEIDVKWNKDTSPWAPKRAVHRITGCSVSFVWAASGETAIKTIIGTQWDGVYIDENAGTQRIIDEVMPRLGKSATRNRLPDGKSFGGFVLWGSTETKCSQAQANFLDNCENPDMKDYASFTLLKGDNAEAIDPEVMASTLAGLSEEQRSIRLDGDKSAMDNVLIYPVMQNPDKVDRIVRTEPYVPSQHDNIIAAFDFGIRHPAGLLIGHINPKAPRVINITYAHKKNNKTLGYFADLLIRYLNGRKLWWMVYDKHGNKRNMQTEKSDIQQLTELLMVDGLWSTGSPIMLSSGSKHESGIHAVRTFLDPPERVSEIPLVSIDKPTVENGTSELIRELRNYRGNEDANFSGSYGVVKKEDELCDTLRYLVTKNPCWNDFGKNIEKPWMLPPGLKNEPQSPAEDAEIDEATKARIAREAESEALWRMHNKKRNAKGLGWKRRTLL